MPQFSYHAKKGPDELVDGLIEAASLDEAVEKLGEEGILPIRLAEVAPGTAAPEKVPAASDASKAPAPPAPRAAAAFAPAPVAKPSGVLFSRVKSSEITLFGRELASLVKAGVPILRAILIISEQSTNPKLRELLTRVHDEINNGKTLSWALSQYPKYFPPIYIAMIRTGEDSGTLHEVLLRISDYRQRQEEIFSRLRVAMAYPALMAVTGVGTIVFMLTFVIPKLTTLFRNMGSHLPLPTQILMKVSSLFQKPWFWSIAAVAIVTMIVTANVRRTQMRAAWSRLSLQLPVIKDFVMKAELARFSRTLELLLKSGIPILRAIEVTAPVLNNTVLRAQFEKAQTDLTGGGSLGKSLKNCKVFPLFMTNLISVGEESGNLEEATREIAQFYERETDEAIRVMTSLLEPLMILVMGLVVGFIVIAMLLPMFELNLAVH